MSGDGRPPTRGAHRQPAAHRQRDPHRESHQHRESHRHRGPRPAQLGRSYLGIVAPAAVFVAAAATLPAAGLGAAATPLSPVPLSAAANTTNVSTTVNVANLANAVAAPAVAATDQSTTTGQIVDAVRTSPLTAAVPASAYSVVDVRVSPADPAYATARLAPTTDLVGPAVATLHHGPAGWTVVDLGSDEGGGPA